ncbi:MAG: hypothetical protein KAJ37_11090, partial [Candidatus Krumholzibacteria bacterium]|nr:hypothetical protein [Candidatus Krumholzibacteria bacterium]
YLLTDSMRKSNQIRRKYRSTMTIPELFRSRYVEYLTIMGGGGDRAIDKKVDTGRTPVVP